MHSLGGWRGVLLLSASVSIGVVHSSGLLEMFLFTPNCVLGRAMLIVYGYESNPNTPIGAGSCDSPEPSSSSTADAAAPSSAAPPSAAPSSHGSSLGMLALGTRKPR
jgi:hypothetical protein